MANMPPQLGQAGDIFYREQAKLAKDTASAVQSVWYSMTGTNFSEKAEWFTSVGSPAIAQLIRNGQFLSLSRAAQYMKVVETIQGMPGQAGFTPEAFMFETEPLEEVLNANVYTHIGNTLQGVPENTSMRLIAGSLVLNTASVVQDTGRDAVSAVTAAGDYYGYVRRLQLPSCKRCTVMAGKEFKKQTEFERHERCDCQTIPIAESYDDATTDPKEAIQKGQVTGLSKADTEAILEHDADISQVINASGGLSTETLFGQKVRTTTVGKSSRAIAGKRLGDLQKQKGSRYRQSQNTRLSVGQILKLAGGDPDRAKEMLYNHGYVT